MTAFPDPQNLRQSDADHILHPASIAADVAAHGPAGIIASGKGSTVVDVDGTRLLDAVGGLWCVNAGYGRQEIGDAMARAAGELGYFHTFTGMSNPQQIALAERLMAMVPKTMGRVFFGSSGSDCNDTLMKIVWYVNYLRGTPEKRKIISRKQAYHGTTIATASLTGLASFHKGFGLPLAEVRHVSAPDYFRNARPGESETAFSARLAAELDDTIQHEGPDTVGAFIAEPIMGAGGVIAPPDGYFEAIQPVLKKHGVFLICDEVVCGFGRLGTWFGHTAYPIQPDMIATAKGLTSGYFPLSAGFISRDIWDTLRQGSATMGAFAHGFTYAGHPVGCAAALANLDILEREGLVEQAAETGAYLHHALEEAFADHPHIGQVRGKGLLAALQLVEDKTDKRLYDTSLKTAGKVAAAVRKRGVLVRPLPTVDSLAMSPPLVFTRAEVGRLIDTVKAALNEVCGG